MTHSVVDKDLEYIRDSCRREFDAMAGSRVLITGGAGFLGYYLCQAFAHYNSNAPTPISVTVADNYLRGVPPWLEAVRSRGADHFTLLSHDVTKQFGSSHRSFQYIIHAASVASPAFYRRYPLDTIYANVWGLRNLVEMFIAHREPQAPSGFLFFSSSEIYGNPDPSHVPTPESYNGNVSCTGPRACYDESKRLGETLCVSFVQTHGLPIVIVRPFNNYGPGLRLDDRRVIADFGASILAGQDIELMSDGSPTRTFCYVADAITGYIKALILGKAGEAYNIGVGAPEISMMDLANLMAGLSRQELDYQGRVVSKPSEDEQYLTDNPARRCPQIAKARRELGYNPTVSLEDGLRRTLRWYGENKSWWGGT